MKNSNAIKLANSLSLALNPFALMSVVFLISLFKTDLDPVAQTRWLSVILLGNFLIPFWWLYYLDQQGFVLDDKLSNTKLHRERLVALIPLTLIVLIEVMVMTFK